MRRKWFYIVPAALIGMVLFAFLGGEIVKLLWNWLMPALFDLRQITFWQAIGLLALSRILVGGFGLRSGRSYSRRRMRERWERMTPEERERFRDRMGRCGMEPVEPPTVS